jgi:hypothetical protein
MVISKQGRLNGKTEQEVGERAKEARKVERSRERGDDGCENQKIKEVSPCSSRRDRELSMSAWMSFTASSSFIRTDI